MSIKAVNLCFAYGERIALREVSFAAEKGEFLSVLGTNGAGKSTLFRCMLGLLTPKQGDTYIDGQAISEMKAVQLAKKIAYIPQSHNPVFNYTVLDMVLMGTTAQGGRFSSPGKAQLSAAEGALARLDIAYLRNRGYANISGGERQLVLIARALAQQAGILVMDEPSSNLDFGNKMRVMETVKGLSREGYTVIQSTHDPDQAYFYSDKILALRDGAVLAYGTPQETICSALISKLYGVDVEVCRLREDVVRVCIPAESGEGNGKDCG